MHRTFEKVFSIKAKKPWKLLQLRRDFLNLCPIETGNISDDAIMSDYKDLLSNINPLECEARHLNNKIQTKRIEIECGEKNCWNKLIRYTNSMPSFCQKLAHHEYTDIILPKYTCTGKYYELEVFNRGYELQTITKAEYNRLNDKNRAIGTYEDKRGREKTIYYKKIPTERNCWVD